MNAGQATGHVCRGAPRRPRLPLTTSRNPVKADLVALNDHGLRRPLAAEAAAVGPELRHRDPETAGPTAGWQRYWKS